MQEELEAATELEAAMEVKAATELEARVASLKQKPATSEIKLVKDKVKKIGCQPNKLVMRAMVMYDEQIRKKQAEKNAAEDKASLALLQKESKMKEERRRKKEKTKTEEGPVEKKARQEPEGEVRCALLLNLLNSCITFLSISISKKLLFTQLCY